MFVLHCSVDFNKLYDDDDDEMVKTLISKQRSLGEQARYGGETKAIKAKIPRPR